MLTINFQIDKSNKKPELYVNSLVEDTYNCSLYFRIISAGFNNVSEVDKLFFDLTKTFLSKKKFFFFLRNDELQL
jgi:hypothetical protein